MKKLTTSQWRAWIRALRSGKFKQGKNALKTPRNTYCCLGVLCAVTRTPGRPKLQITNSDNGAEACKNKMLYRFLNDLLGAKFAGDLMEMNDAGRTFKVIAKRIEQHATEQTA